MDTTANRIATAMALKNLKQVDIIEKTGINKGALSSYLAGRYEPKQDNIYKIAKALDVNEAWLMGYDVPMERRDNTVQLSDQGLSLISHFYKLNSTGKDKAIERVEELTKISDYVNDYIELPAAARGNSSIKVKTNKKQIEDNLNKPNSTGFDD